MRVIITNDVLSVDGLRWSDRSMVGSHWNAVGRYLDTGDAGALQGFEGATVGGYDGIPVLELETRRDPIDDYALIGVFNVDSIYEKE
ncbi:hypothetical protein ACTXG6_45790 [Pseudonocardia sp. Cha107L01]|uniref:hypothetical protein n=1 Tax=Pseudonocardia sp. Cha107L01 TaxID=3457576 RepID=UPI00403E5AB7